MLSLRTLLFGKQAEPIQTTPSLPVPASAICLVTGLTVSAVVASQALPAQVATAIAGGAAVAQVTETATGAAVDAAGTILEVTGETVSRVGRGLFPTSRPVSTDPAYPLWPDADLDTFSTTDLEDLAVFAADVFEFVQQEYALLAATYGENRVIVAGLTLAYGLYNQADRIMSAFRLK